MRPRYRLPQGPVVARRAKERGGGGPPGGVVGAVTKKSLLLWGTLAIAFLGQGPSLALGGGGAASLRNATRGRRLQQGRVCEPMRMGEPINENTRTCLRQCQLNSENEVVPDFFDWEAYCYATATDDEWDKECEKFYCCLFGCDVFDQGNGRSICYDADAGSRTDLLNIVQMKNIQKAQRCDAEKCRGFCVRSEFGSCRELQYTRSCKASKLGLYKCDVKCNGAWRRSGRGHWWSAVGLACFLALLALGRPV